MKFSFQYNSVVFKGSVYKNRGRVEDILGSPATEDLGPLYMYKR